MTRIDFYVLPATGGANQAQIACRLTAKAFDQGHQVYIHTQSAESVEQLDQLLWTYRDTSFVPHQRASETVDPMAPVVIGDAEPPEHSAEIMINLADPVPSFFSHFERVIEIVPGADDGAGREQARARYRFYQERGYKLNTHEL